MMTLLFKTAPRHSAEVLPGVPKCRKAGARAFRHDLVLPAVSSVLTDLHYTK